MFSSIFRYILSLSIFNPPPPHVRVINQIDKSKEYSHWDYPLLFYASFVEGFFNKPSNDFLHIFESNQYDVFANDNPSLKRKMHNTIILDGKRLTVPKDAILKNILDKDLIHSSTRLHSKLTTIRDMLHSQSRMQQNSEEQNSSSKHSNDTKVTQQIHLKQNRFYGWLKGVISFRWMLSSSTSNEGGLNKRSKKTPKAIVNNKANIVKYSSLNPDLLLLYNSLSSLHGVTGFLFSSIKLKLMSIYSSSEIADVLNGLFVPFLIASTSIEDSLPAYSDNLQQINSIVTTTNTNQAITNDYTATDSKVASNVIFDEYSANSEPTNKSIEVDNKINGKDSPCVPQVNISPSAPSLSEVDDENEEFYSVDDGVNETENSTVYFDEKQKIANDKLKITDEAKETAKASEPNSNAKFNQNESIVSRKSQYEIQCEEADESIPCSSSDNRTIDIPVVPKFNSSENNRMFKYEIQYEEADKSMPRGSSDNGTINIPIVPTLNFSEGMEKKNAEDYVSSHEIDKILSIKGNHKFNLPIDRKIDAYSAVKLKDQFIKTSKKVYEDVLVGFSKYRSNSEGIFDKKVMLLELYADLNLLKNLFVFSLNYQNICAQEEVEDLRINAREVDGVVNGLLNYKSTASLIADKAIIKFFRIFSDYRNNDIFIKNDQILIHQKRPKELKSNEESCKNGYKIEKVLISSEEFIKRLSYSLYRTIQSPTSWNLSEYTTISY